MKSYKNLYPQLTSFANLELAWRKARKGKRSKLAVAAFEFNAEGELFQLQRELQDKSFNPGHTAASSSTTPKNVKSALPPSAIE